jgi:hypothetical protein
LYRRLLTGRVRDTHPAGDEAATGMVGSHPFEQSQKTRGVVSDLT